jgi:hypothetical protein
LRRLALAVTSELRGVEAGEIIVDAYSLLPRSARLVSSALLLPRVASRTDLPATTLETIARDAAEMAKTSRATVTVRRGGADWKRDILGSWLATLDAKTVRGRVLTNAAVALMNEDDRFVPADLERAYASLEALLS